MMDSKECSKCKEVKPLSMFHIDKTKKDGYTYQCKMCRLKKKKEWSLKPEVKKYRARLAREFRATKEGREYSRKIIYKCSDKRRFGGLRDRVFKEHNYTCLYCGAKEKLCIHHLDCNGRNSKTSNNKIENLIVMCLSCHMKLHRRLQNVG